MIDRSLLRLASFALLASAASLACDGGAGDSQGPKPGLEGQGPAGALDHPPVDAPPGAAASTQRLTVAQLRRSFAVALGKDKAGNDITWRLPNGADGFDATASALGEPDYLGITARSTDPSLLYAKFIDDAARSGCGQALDADLARPQKADRVILRHVEWTDVAPAASAAIDTNLRYLKLRMHGVKLASSPEATKSLTTLFAASVAGSTDTDPQLKVRAGWLTVCVALVTASEFQIY
ncbi:MAG: hypothetical protein JST00_37400 [Deltaproteobacteria bacterium]|nr:hypothetical protein [Deltaproteobacteria bacterium]